VNESSPFPPNRSGQEDPSLYPVSQSNSLSSYRSQNHLTPG